MIDDSIDFDVQKLNEAELAELIEHHNQLYWSRGEPEISDERYDQLLMALRHFNPQHPLLEAVNAPAVASSGKVHHPRPMLSLDKAYSLEEVLEWAGKYARSMTEAFLVEPKYDGISARYADGVLATRGDGFDGENISDKLPLIELEAPNYRGPLDRPARGEIVIRDDDFQQLYSRIVRKGGGHYKNSRNAVAGIMGLKDIAPMEQQQAKLTLVDYDLISYSVTFAELAGRWPELLAEIEALPYPMDGIVIKLADQEYSDSLGDTAHHPRGQIAFKFSGIRRESVIRAIEWSFGKNNLTPVAEIDPVEIGGVTIQRATLHNVQNILDHDIEVNDQVIVERAGDVIPYIVSATPGEGRYSNIPTHCPSCGALLERRGPELCCVNPDCFESNLQKLAAAVKNIGIEQLGEPTLRNMMTQLHVRKLSDIFRLTAKELLQLEAFGQKKTENLLKEIAAARQVPDHQLLAALNIPNVGPNVAKLLLADHTLAELGSMALEELQDIAGIGPERARAIHRTLRDQAGFIAELLECVTVVHAGKSENRPTVCFTGKMPEKRSYYEDLARQHGLAPVDSVTRELSLLVAADPAAAGGKLAKARKLDIKIVSLEDFLARPEQPATPIETESPVPAAEEPEQLRFGF
ncbi:helix-hairpin-helix domain-containing protein [Victivallis sp. Marseille-Q1083]|uniref:helix-hairpin-helix domain-containing protein n=1 Tax=Victivallis sp. Marseille-Q1083 TaxID=2717288 RepID=UPI00158BE170|nr:helix-hairpin-helix domain-containing protein [Victivallis sp. Marseille-Q1083]